MSLENGIQLQLCMNFHGESAQIYKFSEQILWMQKPLINVFLIN